MSLLLFSLDKDCTRNLFSDIQILQHHWASSCVSCNRLRNLGILYMKPCARKWQKQASLTLHSLKGHLTKKVSIKWQCFTAGVFYVKPRRYKVRYTDCVYPI